MSDEKYVDYKQMGARIGIKRRKKGMKQAQVNELIDVNYKYLSYVESGKTIPSIDVLMKICAILDTTPDFLLLGAVRSDSDDEIIREKIKLITGKRKIALLSNFIDWLADQENL